MLACYIIEFVNHGIIFIYFLVSDQNYVDNTSFFQEENIYQMAMEIKRRKQGYPNKNNKSVWI